MRQEKTLKICLDFKIEKDLEISNFVDAQGLRYYNADLHRGSFALPNFVKNMFKRELA